MTLSDCMTYFAGTLEKLSNWYSAVNGARARWNPKVIKPNELNEINRLPTIKVISKLYVAFVQKIKKNNK